jgi:hypothetical protein
VIHIYITEYYLLRNFWDALGLRRSLHLASIMNLFTKILFGTLSFIFIHTGIQLLFFSFYLHFDYVYEWIYMEVDSPSYKNINNGLLLYFFSINCNGRDLFLLKETVELISHYTYVSHSSMQCVVTISACRPPVVVSSLFFYNRFIHSF